AKASERERRLLHDARVFNGLAAASPLTITAIANGRRMRAAATRRFGPQNAKAIVFDGTKESNPRTWTMHPTRVLQLCALPMALTLLLRPSRHHAPQQSQNQAPAQ